MWVTSTRAFACAIYLSSVTVKVDKSSDSHAYTHFFVSCFPQSDNHADDVDKVEPKETKAADDAFNNNGFHSTALIKDVIHKKPASSPWEMQAKSEVEERVTAETYKTSAKPAIKKTIRPSFDSRERDSYDDAIEDYKNRVSKAVKLDLPKVDITKRRELFEKETKGDISNVVPSALDSKLGSEIVSIKDRISSLRSNLAASTVSAPPKKLELPTNTRLRDRLSSLQQVSLPVDEFKKNLNDVQFKNVLEARNEIELKQQTVAHHSGKLLVNDDNESLESTDPEDSGVQTTDVSCAVSQADEQVDQHIDEFQQVQDKVSSVPSGHAAFKAPAAQEEAEVDDESSVSCSEDNETRSVLVLTLDGTNKIAENDRKSTNKVDFIQSDLQQPQFDDVLMDNNYVYECIINRSEHQTGLEKSNSIDTAISLCSSSDGQSLMEDDKIFR